jgi:hypothetical protein
MAKISDANRQIIHNLFVVLLREKGVRYDLDFDFVDALNNEGDFTPPAPIVGGTNTVRVYNVKDAPYNAVGDGSTDDALAIQAAIDAASAAGGGIVYLPSGTFRVHDNFLRLKSPNVHLIGSGDSTTIHCTNTKSLVIQVVPQAPATVVAGLPSGQTNEHGLDFNARPTDYIQCSDVMAPGALNGLSAMAVRGWFKPTTINAYSLIASYGKLYSNITENEAFKIIVEANGAITAGMTINGTYRNCNSGAGELIAGNTYHIALTFDGSNIRLFINGALKTTTAAAGTVTMNKWERITLGPRMADMVGSQGLSTAAKGVLSHWEIANVARHTAPFTTPTAFSEDGNTLFGLRLQDSSWYKDSAVRTSGPQYAWIPWYQPWFSAPGVTPAALGGIRISNFNIDGGGYGIFVAASPATFIDHIKMTSIGSYGITLYDNNYYSQIDYCHLMGSRAPLYTYGASGVGIVSRTKLRGGTFNQISHGGMDYFVQVHHEGENDTYVGAVMIGRGGSLNWPQFEHCSFGDEASSGPLEANVILDDLRGAQFNNCAFEHARGTDKCRIIADRGSRVGGFPIRLLNMSQQGVAGADSDIKLFGASGGAGSWVKGLIEVDGYMADYSPMKPTTNANTDTIRFKGAETYEWEGFIDITNAGSGVVAFATAEADANYKVTGLTFTSQAGTPNAGSTRGYAGTLTGSGFTITLDAATGVGNTVRVYWKARRG